MRFRRAASLIEMLVVLAILSVMLGMFFPVMGSARRRAQEVECKNRLHQINLAVADYVHTNKRLPPAGSPGVVGGWTIAMLPYLEQNNLRNAVVPGVSPSAAPAALQKSPDVFVCPIRAAIKAPAPGMASAHFVLIPGDQRKSYHVSDAPLNVAIPWATGPEMAFSDFRNREGPHEGGYFSANGFHNGVTWVRR